MLLRYWWLWTLILAILFGLGVAFNFLGIVLIGSIILCGVGAVVAAIASFVDADIRDGVKWVLIAVAIFWFASFFL